MPCAVTVPPPPSAEEDAARRSELTAVPPTYQTYRPPRTTAEGGATMLVSAVFALCAVVALVLAVYSKIFDSRTFGQIANLLALAIALLLLAVYVLVWEIVLRLIARELE
jgi:hypothetical protein